jgi:hypothetical protein
LSSTPPKVSRLNRAVLWHLQLCLRLLDRLGYGLAATHVSSAIDALTNEAISEGEISELDLAREERVKLVLELFEKHGDSYKDESDSNNRG